MLILKIVIIVLFIDDIGVTKKNLKVKRQNAFNENIIKMRICVKKCLFTIKILSVLKAGWNFKQIKKSRFFY